LIPPDGERDPAPEPPGLPTPAEAPPAPPEQAPARIGTGTFTIEGRAAPALFVVGWLATLIGGVVLFVSLQTGPGVGKLVLFVGGLVLLAVGLIAAAGSQGIERRARGVGPYAGPSPVLVFLACFPTAAVPLVLLGIPLELAGIDLDGPVVAVLALVVQALVYVLLIRLLVVDAGALTWAQMGVRRPSWTAVREFATGAAWALPIILLTAPIAAILVSLFDVVPDSPLPPSGEPVGIGLNLLAGAIIAPIGEELFFRAFTTTAWVMALGRTRGIVQAGLAFAFVHVLAIEAASFEQGLPLALIGFAVRVPIGIALCWIFVRRGTIWAPLGLHAAFNAILLVISETAGQAPAA
jgi:uncharacterized protein